MDNIENVEKIKYVKLFMKGISIALIMSLILLLCVSILISTTNIKENLINPCIIFVSAISLFVGGMTVSKRIKRNGILLGILVGLFYMIILYLVSSLVNMDFSIDKQSVYMILFGMIGGAIGGILGVNS